MKTLFLALLLATGAAAQNGLSFYVDTTDGVGTAGSPSVPPLTTAFQFSSTAVGQTASVMIRMVNTSSAAITVNTLFVGPVAGSSAADPNFTIAGLQANATIAPSNAKVFYLEFTPTATGTLTGYLQGSLNGQNGPFAIATLSGTGLSPALSLTCSDSLVTACDGSTSLPANASVLFGPTNGVAIGSSYSIPFTLTNNSSAAISAPAISSTVYAVAAFTSPTLAALPSTIAAGSTVSFTIIFTPQAIALGPSSAQTALLTIGSSTYTLQGYELITNNNDPIQITCVFPSGQPCQGSANTYTMGPLPNTLSLIFRVTNPNPVGTVDADITLSAPPALSDTTDFALSSATLAPTNSTSGATAVSAGQSITLQPGYTLTFQVTFTGSVAATSSLTIGSGITYTLNAQPAPAVGSAQSDLPGIALLCGTTPCANQTFANMQQVQATLAVSTATTAAATLAISFKPLVSGVNDTAIQFIAPYTQSNLNFSFTTASLQGMLGNGQPQFTFQTGSSAGTITFTLTDSATLQSVTLATLTIAPEKVQITPTSAVRSSPNLILTIQGYDNTYSAGQLSFSFYGTNGSLINATPITVNAASAFQQYFFSPTNASGSAFSLQVTFPVSGNVEQISSVVANITNSVGQASVSASFTDSAPTP